MATQAQIAANRINAQKSTGPKTPEGRDAVRLNGLKHGLTSEILVLPGESVADFEALLDSLEAEHRPSTPTEVILVRQMATASWRLQRLLHVEAAYYRLRRSALEVHYTNYYGPDLTEPDRLAIIAERDTTNTLDNFSRHETRLQRSFQNALIALHRLRSQRGKEMTNQSQSQAAPSPVAAGNTGKAPPEAGSGHAEPPDRHPPTGARPRMTNVIAIPTHAVP